MQNAVYSVMIQASKLLPLNQNVKYALGLVILFEPHLLARYATVNT